MWAAFIYLCFVIFLLQTPRAIGAYRDTVAAMILNGLCFPDKLAGPDGNQCVNTSVLLSLAWKKRGIQSTVRKKGGATWSICNQLAIVMQHGLITFALLLSLAQITHVI